MKILSIILFMFALFLTACHKIEIPNGGNTSQDSIVPTATDTLVRKYLTKQLLNDDPERIMLDIDWNDDCTRILHVKYGLGYGSILDYDFVYYNSDSIFIAISMPPESYPLWELWCNSMVIHLNQNKIDSICCYANGVLTFIEHYYYNDKGKLVERKYLNGASDLFTWEGNNVVACCMMGRNYNFDTLTDYIHPHFTLPFYLSNEVAFEVRKPLFKPLWKNQPIELYYNCYEADEDGYLTKMYHKSPYDTLEGCITYYYITPNNSPK